MIGKIFLSDVNVMFINLKDDENYLFFYMDWIDIVYIIFNIDVLRDFIIFIFVDNEMVN